MPSEDDDKAALRATLLKDIDDLRAERHTAEENLRELKGRISTLTRQIGELQERYADVAPPPEPEFVPEVVVTMKPRSEWPKEFSDLKSGKPG